MIGQKLYQAEVPTAHRCVKQRSLVLILLLDQRSQLICRQGREVEQVALPGSLHCSLHDSRQS